MTSDFDLGGFEPCNDAHAIVACSVSVGFAGLLPDSAWPELRKVVLTLAKKFDLGVPQPFYGLSVTFNPAAVNVALNAPQAGASEAVGLTFSRLGPDDAIEERVVISKDAIHFLNGAYVRWGPFVSRISSMISMIYPVLIEHLPFAYIKTEYWDRFDRSEGVFASDVTRVVNKEATFIASGVVDPTEPFHSHCGRFERISETVRRLKQVRVDVTETAEELGIQQAVSIYTMMQDVINARGYEPTEAQQITVDQVLGMIQGQHVALKRLIDSVITRETADRLGLKIS